METTLPTTLPLYLKQHAAQQTRRFLEIVADVSPEQATADRDPHWPTQRWGIGQDGSILGIVCHVAAWKEITLSLLTPDRKPISREELEARPLPSEWSDVCAWYTQISREWSKALDAMPEAQFSESIVWEGQFWPLGAMIAEIIAHDVQHSAQIEYLLQRHKARATAR